MLTKIVIKNFKRFEEVEVPLDNGMVFVGPNNSGKTSALEALVLWYVGLQQWVTKESKANGSESGRHRGIVINRTSLVLVPTPHANLLWHNRKVMEADNVRRLIELTVHGINTANQEWKCGFEFDYATAETFYCRKLRLDSQGNNRMLIPADARNTSMGLLPPMSGLAADEPLIQAGRVTSLIGQGRTAEVLRNICYSVCETSDDKWKTLALQVNKLFGVELHKPIFRPPTGDLGMTYKEGGKTFDMQSAGRGMQQVTLLLAFLYDQPPGAVLLLDEPDAHLEVLRQEQIYQLLNDAASKSGSQVIVASHSEKLLNVAAKDNVAVSFVGAPKLLATGKHDEVLKSLREIGWDQYEQARTKGWVLYVEGLSDRKILAAFAEKLGHLAKNHLANVFCKEFNTDKPHNARRHFKGLKEASADLIGLLLADQKPESNPPDGLKEISWHKHEIENYLFTKETLLNYADSFFQNNKSANESDTEVINIPGIHEGKTYYRRMMESEIRKFQEASKLIGDHDLFSDKSKASDKLLQLLKNFSKAAKVQTFAKKDFYQLVNFIPDNEIDSEIKEKLDVIADVAAEAETRSGS